MTANFNKELGLVEIYHNAMVVDTVPNMSDAFTKIDFFDKLLRLRLYSLNQDKGKYHINYIRMLAQEISWWENSKSSGNPMKWNDCIKLALRIHVSKMRG